MNPKDRSSDANKHSLQETQSFGAKELMDIFTSGKGENLLYYDELVNDLLREVNLFVSTAQLTNKPLEASALVGSAYIVAELIKAHTMIVEAQEEEEAGR